MPAPKTSTDRMPTVDSSQATPVSAITWVATTAASRSAMPTTVRGMSQRNGLR